MSRFQPVPILLCRPLEMLLIFPPLLEPPPTMLYRRRHLKPVLACKFCRRGGHVLGQRSEEQQHRHHGVFAPAGSTIHNSARFPLASVQSRLNAFRVRCLWFDRCSAATAC